MKKIFLGLIILFFTTSIFSEMKQIVKVGEVAKFGYGFFSSTGKRHYRRQKRGKHCLLECRH